MENLTHSLLGGVLAQLALPPAAETAVRRVFFGAGIVAANLPDIDVAYTWIMPEPLGTLLHHRGHTHTIVGLLAAGLALAVAGRLLPAVRRLARPARKRLALLSSVALASHLVLDFWNSYGIHPFHPFDSRWIYGDAVFIFEPWLWLFWGAAVAVGAERRWTRLLVGGAITILPLLLTILGVLSVATFGLLAVAGGVFAWGCRRLSPTAGAATALAAGGAFVLLLFGLGAVARAQVRELMAAEVRGRIVDVALSSLPAEPLCWTAIAIEKDEARGRYLLHRGTLSLAPALLPPERCALHRLWRLPSIPWAGRSRLARAEPMVESLDVLRHRATSDCRVKAWMQFGRAPFFRGDEIRDLRYETGPRENFTAMAIREGSACPSHVTHWAMPRADLLGEGRGVSN